MQRLTRLNTNGPALHLEAEKGKRKVQKVFGGCETDGSIEPGSRSTSLRVYIVCRHASESLLSRMYRQAEGATFSFRRSGGLVCIVTGQLGRSRLGVRFHRSVHDCKEF